MCPGALTDLKEVPFKAEMWGFPGGAVVKNPPANAGDTGSSPGPGREDPTCRGATKPVRHNC